MFAIKFRSLLIYAFINNHEHYFGDNFQFVGIGRHEHDMGDHCIKEKYHNENFTDRGGNFCLLSVVHARPAAPNGRQTDLLRYKQYIIEGKNDVYI